jgi:hypothetical protein
MTNGDFEQISSTMRVERGADERVRLFTGSPFEALAGYSSRRRSHLRVRDDGDDSR